MKTILLEKRGISVMIGYVLLVVFILSISAVVYGWLKTYVPGEAIECPDEVSLYITNATYFTSVLKLNLTIINNGNFKVRGYSIQIQEDENDEFPTLNITEYLDAGSVGGKLGSSIIFGGSEGDGLQPGETETHTFNIPSDQISSIYLVRITPTRFETINGKSTFTSCGRSPAEQLVTLTS